MEQLVGQCVREDGHGGGVPGAPAAAAPSLSLPLPLPSPFASGGPLRQHTTSDSFPEGAEAAAAPDASFMSDSPAGDVHTPWLGRLHAAASSGSGTSPRAGTLATPGSITGPSAPAAEPRPSPAARTAANAFYDRVLGAAAAAVEHHAEADAKSGARLRLENYAFLRLALQGLPAAPGSALQRHCTDAAASRNAALAAYTEQRLAELKLSPLLEIGQRLAAGRAGREGADGGESAPPSAQELRQGLAATAAAGLDKRAAAVHAQLHKHLASSSPYLIGVVWER
jgi:hypothetical protein